MPCNYLSDNHLSWTSIQTRSDRGGLLCCGRGGCLAVSSIGVLSIALGFCRDVSVHLTKGAEKAAAALIGPGGEQQRDRHWLAAGLPIPDHGYERHDARAGADQEHWFAGRPRPEKVSAKRPAKLDRVAYLGDVVEERGDLAVREALDRQLDHLGIARGRGDRVAAHGSVAVGRSQPHVNVLTGRVVERFGEAEKEALDSRRSRRDLDNRAALPSRGCGNRFSHAGIAARATDRRTCGTRAAPRSRPRRAP